MPYLNLVAADNVLPLGWEVMRHFGTVGNPANAPAFEVDGEPVDGAALSTRLRNLGYGPHLVTVRGEFVPYGMGHIRDARQPFEMQGEFELTITTQELADFVYARAREFIATFPKGETPPQVFITQIEIGEPEPEEPEEPETIYIDRMTGALVTEDTWQRSRRAIRAAAKKRGVKPRTGRYVRVKV